MRGEYELWLTTDTGLPYADTSGKTILTTFTRLEASKVANDVGRLFVALPTSFNTNLIQKDRMIQVWRKPPDGTRSLFNVYLINKWRFLTSGARQAVWIWGDDPVTLLKRRIVAFRSEQAESSKTDFADDMMKEIVDENLVNPAIGPRAMPGVTVAPDTGSGPSLSKAFSFDNVLKTLKSLNEASRDLGTEVFFDMVVSSVTNTAIAFQFRTFINQPGQNIADRVSFDQELGNLENPELEYDYTNEANYIYAGGQGDGITRLVWEDWDVTRIAISQYGRTEAFADARRAKAPAAGQEEARSALEEGQPKTRFLCDALNTDATQFGRDWNWGDRVTQRYRGQDGQAIVYVVNLVVTDDGRESVGARLNLVESI